MPGKVSVSVEWLGCIELSFSWHLAIIQYSNFLVHNAFMGYAEIFI